MGLRPWHVGKIKACAGACLCVPEHAQPNVQGCGGPGKMAAACPGNRLTAFALPQNLVDLARVIIFAPLVLPHGAVVALPVMGVF